MGWLYLGGHTIQEVGGEMMMGLSIYGVAVMDGLLYSRFNDMWLLETIFNSVTGSPAILFFLKW